jgi:hypothetical protein
VITPPLRRLPFLPGLLLGAIILHSPRSEMLGNVASVWNEDLLPGRAGAMP